MRPAVALLVVYALSPVSAHAQTSLGSSEQPVIVEGCLSGKRLKPDKESAINNLVFGAPQIKELRLEGQPALMKTLQKQHDGHQDQISDIVIVPADKDVKVQGKQVGKRTRITTTQSGGSPDPRPPAPGATRPASAGTTSSPFTGPLDSQKWLRMR